jgi:hypothetical protein
LHLVLDCTGAGPIATGSSTFPFSDPAPVLSRGVGDPLLLLGQTATLQLAAHFRGDVIAIEVIQNDILVRRGTIIGGFKRSLLLHRRCGRRILVAAFETTECITKTATKQGLGPREGQIGQTAPLDVLRTTAGSFLAFPITLFFFHCAQIVDI